MTKNIVSSDREHSIKSAIRKMVKKNIGSIVVTEKGNPVGIVTERDVLKNIGYGRLNPENPVGTIMSKPLITTDLNSTISEAADLMKRHNIRRILVKENEKFVGVITQRDLQLLMVDTFKSLSLM
ncbi:MAG: cyclic nucleotide-binding/CBS domain-containing protein [Candidatus Eiseniibacteriota bacterium]